MGQRSLISTPLFTMDLKSSLTQAWNASVYQMVLVIVLFQSVVPYLKLIFIAMSWYVPEKRIGRLFFIRVLTLFDHLGRFQLISGFILVLYSIAFHFHIDSNTTATKTSNAIVDSFIVVYTDFWMFMGIVVMSILLNSHVLRELRLEHYDKFESPNLTSDSAIVSALIWIFLALGGGLMVGGVILNSFILEFQGFKKRKRKVAVYKSTLFRTGWLHSLLGWHVTFAPVLDFNHGTGSPRRVAGPDEHRCDLVGSSVLFACSPVPIAPVSVYWHVVVFPRLVIP